MSIQQNLEHIISRIRAAEARAGRPKGSARLVEVAAMDYHLKDMGIDMAGEFNRRLMSNFQAPESGD